MGNDGLRGYVRTLREGRLRADTERPSRFAQTAFGEAIGLHWRTYLDWETGRSKSIKTGVLLKVLALLDVPWDDAARLADASYEEGVVLATQRLAGQPGVPEEDPDVVFERVLSEHMTAQLNEGDRALAENLAAGLRVLWDRARRAAQPPPPRDEET